MALQWLGARLAGSGLLAIVCLTIGVHFVSSEIDFKNPVRSAAYDEITNLPGLTYQPKFRQYSGYLEADDEKPTNRFWHYWFVESKSDPAKDPLVLWLNGGPGCSSLLGLLTELGPFRVPEKNKLVDNPFAWNERANVVFMESPAGVGFSYAVDGSTEANDDTTARQNYLALKSFLRKFPQYKNNPLYLTGESYGGVYLPTLAVLVDEDPELQLKGVAIGNGYLDANKLAESLVYFSYYHGLVGKSTWQGLSKYCCDGKPPARGLCAFVDPKRSKECTDFVGRATDVILASGVNPYNLYDQCVGATTTSTNNNNLQIDFNSFREFADKRMMLSAFNLSSTHKVEQLSRDKKHTNRISKQHKLAKLADNLPCIDDSLTNDYLNKNEVRRSLHIPEKLETPFTSCGLIDYSMIYPNQKDGLGPQMRKLLASKRKLTLLVYNGDVDLMCNFFGDEWFVDDLGRKVIQDYSPWFTNGQLSGFAKYFDGIAYFTVKGSGHMVPTDRPAEALNMFHQFLDGLKPQPSEGL